MSFSGTFVAFFLEIIIEIELFHFVFPFSILLPFPFLPSFVVVV